MGKGVGVELCEGMCAGNEEEGEGVEEGGG